MPLTTGSRFGELVLVPFPFTDQRATKRRPAVVVSSAAYHRARPDLILMAVTSQIRGAAAMGDIMIHAWQEAGLIHPSVVKPILTTVERGLVLRQLGRLAADDRHALQQALTTILGD